MKIYDANGNNITTTVLADTTSEKVQIKERRTTYYEYDSLSRVIKMTNSLGNCMTYEYNASGDVAKSVDYSGNITENIYDSQGRIIKKIVNGDIIKYSYKNDDGTDANRLTTVNNSEGTIKYLYDSYGRIISKIDPNNIEIKYSYTISGQISEIKTPYGNTSYEYDLMERLVRVVDHSGNITVYTYDCLGNRETLTYANGVKVKYEYDENSNLISEEIVDDKSNLIKKCIYERNKNGYPVLIEETLPDEVTQTCYKYDAVNRLVSEKIKDKDGEITYQYKYDKVGNRLSKKTRVKGDIAGIVDSDTVIKEGVTEYSYNAGNQLLSEEHGSEERTYYYDTNGNLTAIVNGSDVQKYEYNKQNKLAKYTDAQGNQTIYTYDGEGNRISKKSGSDCIKYVVTTFDELSYTLLELDGSRNLTKYYTIGADLISQDNTENNYYYILDAHGSLMYLTNSLGNVVNKYRYDAFGNILSKIDKVDNSYYYNCENYDKESGLYYLRARYLNPQTGTFTQEDTYQGNIYDAISLHKYLFAASNPVVYEDPTGNSFNFADCVATINLMFNSSNGILKSLKCIEFVKKATVVSSTINIAVSMFNIMCGEPISDVLRDVGNIFLSVVTIATATIWEPSYLFSMIVGVIGTGKDTWDTITAIKDRDWCGVVSGIGSITLDVISMGAQIGEHNNWLSLLEESKFVRNGDQKALINIVKEVMMEGGVTEHVKDVLFDWAKAYDSFEDVWNLLYHLK